MSKRACTNCKKSGVKLWRNHGQWSPPFVLLCGPCGVDQFNNDGDDDHGPIERLEADGSHLSTWNFHSRPQMTWELGWFVPAVETTDGSGWWGVYHTNPEAVEAWENWQALPNE